jgi:hypothetical protein
MNNKILKYFYCIFVFIFFTNGCFYTCRNEDLTIEKNLEKQSFKYILYLKEDESNESQPMSTTVKNSFFSVFAKDSQIKEKWFYAGTSFKKFGYPEKIKNFPKKSIIEISYKLAGDLTPGWGILTALSLGLIPSSKSFEVNYIAKIYDQNGKEYQESIKASAETWAGWFFLFPRLITLKGEIDFLEDSFKLALHKVEEKIISEKIVLNQSKSKLPEQDEFRFWIKDYVCGSEIRIQSVRYSFPGKTICSYRFSFFNQTGDLMVLPIKGFFIEYKNKKKLFYDPRAEFSNLVINKKDFSVRFVFFIMDDEYRKNEISRIGYESEDKTIIYAESPKNEEEFKVLLPEF